MPIGMVGLSQVLGFVTVYCCLVDLPQNFLLPVGRQALHFVDSRLIYGAADPLPELHNRDIFNWFDATLHWWRVYIGTVVGWMESRLRSRPWLAATFRPNRPNCDFRPKIFGTRFLGRCAFFEMCAYD